VARPRAIGERSYAADQLLINSRSTSQNRESPSVRCMSLLLAPLRHADRLRRCPFTGVDRK